MDLYLAGHDHHLGLMQPPSGVSYIISGAGAAARPANWTKETVFAHTDLGFTSLTFDKSGIEVPFFGGRGKTLFARHLPCNRKLTEVVAN